VYNPASGQFLTRDPLVQQTGQPYAYAGGDPINQQDPTGQASGSGLVQVIEPDGASANTAARQIRQAILDEFAARNPNRFTVAPVDVRIPQGLALPYAVLPHADVVSLRPGTTNGRLSGDAYNLVNIYANFSDNKPGYRPTPDASAYTREQLANLQIVAAKAGLGPTCKSYPVDLRLGRDYTTAPGPYDQRTKDGQKYTLIPVLTSGGLYYAFGFQEHDPGIVYYSLCRPQRPGEAGIPCRDPLTYDPNPCAFNNGAVCALDFIVTGGSVSGLFRCNSVLSCGFATVGILASAFVVGRLTARAFDAVAVRAVVAQGGLDALKASVTSETTARVTVDNEVHTLTSAETRAFLDDIISLCRCFPAGTKVATRAGSVAIEKLHTGDQVLSENPKTGKVEQERVEAIIVRPVSSLIAIDLSDGSTLKVQPDHPFWVDEGRGLHGSGWLKAGQLRLGDRLRTANGKHVVVVRMHQHAGRAVVYTLTVAHDHTFFVGFARVLVHNSDSCLDIKALLMPEGKPIGTPGSGRGVRDVAGGTSAAQQLFDKLSSGGRDVTPAGFGGDGGGKLVQLPDGGFVSIRYVSKPGDAAIDISGVPGIIFWRIHFGL